MFKSFLKCFLLIAILFYGLSLEAQKRPDLDGLWTGIITQENGFRTQYGLDLHLSQEGEEISGLAFVYADGIRASIHVEGKAHGKMILLLKDTEIIDSEIPENTELCMKDYQLVLKKEEGEWLLVGHWQGITKSSKCDPGKIRLQRLIPRA